MRRKPALQESHKGARLLWVGRNSRALGDRLVEAKWRRDLKRARKVENAAKSWVFARRDPRAYWLPRPRELQRLPSPTRSRWVCCRNTSVMGEEYLLQILWGLES